MVAERSELFDDRAGAKHLIQRRRRQHLRRRDDGAAQHQARRPRPRPRSARARRDWSGRVPRDTRPASQSANGQSAISHNRPGVKRLRIDPQTCPVWRAAEQRRRGQDVTKEPVVEDVGQQEQRAEDADPSSDPRRARAAAAEQRERPAARPRRDDQPVRDRRRLQQRVVRRGSTAWRRARRRTTARRRTRGRGAAPQPAIGEYAAIQRPTKRDQQRQRAEQPRRGRQRQSRACAADAARPAQTRSRPPPPCPTAASTGPEWPARESVPAARRGARRERRVAELVRMPSWYGRSQRDR